MELPDKLTLTRQEYEALAQFFIKHPLPYEVSAGCISVLDGVAKRAVEPHKEDA